MSNKDYNVSGKPYIPPTEPSETKPIQSDKTSGSEIGEVSKQILGSTIKGEKSASLATKTIEDHTQNVNQNLHRKNITSILENFPRNTIISDPVELAKLKANVEAYEADIHKEGFWRSMRHEVAKIAKQVFPDTFTSKTQEALDLYKASLKFLNDPKDLFPTILDKQRVLTSKEYDVAVKRAAMEEKINKIPRQNEELKAADDQVFNLGTRGTLDLFQESEIAESKKQEMERDKSTIQSLGDEIIDLEKDITVLKNELDELNKTLRGQNLREGNLEIPITDKNNQEIIVLKKKIESTQSEIDQLFNEYKALNEKLIKFEAQEPSSNGFNAMQAIQTEMEEKLAAQASDQESISDLKAILNDMLSNPTETHERKEIELQFNEIFQNDLDENFSEKTHVANAKSSRAQENEKLEQKSFELMKENRQLCSDIETKSMFLEFEINKQSNQLDQQVQGILEKSEIRKLFSKHLDADFKKYAKNRLEINNKFLAPSYLKTEQKMLNNLFNIASRYGVYEGAVDYEGKPRGLGKLLFGNIVFETIFASDGIAGTIQVSEFNPETGKTRFITEFDYGD